MPIFSLLSFIFGVECELIRSLRVFLRKRDCGLRCDLASFGVKMFPL